MRSLFTIGLFIIFHAGYGQGISDPDSLRQLAIQKINSSQKAIEGRLDSLSSLNINTAHADTLAAKVDSLATLELSLKIDSIKLISKLDSIQSFDATANIDSLQQNLHQKIQKKLENGRESLNSKIGADYGVSNGINKASEKGAPVKANVPGIDLPSADVSVIDPNIEIPDASIDNPLEDVSGQLEEVEIPTQEDLNVPDLAAMDQVKGKLGKVEKISDQVAGYQGDLEKVREGDYSSMESEVERQATQIGEVGELQKQTGEFNQLKQQKAEYEKQMEALQDEEAAKEQIKSRARKLAVNHFAKHGDKLKAAQKTMAKYKRKYPSLNSIKNLPKRVPIH